MNMTIIAYRKATDLDVQFEDGSIVLHRSYDNFRKGMIKYSISSFVGSQKVMRNGHMCTIIDVRGYEDFDVRFDNGVVNEHQNMSNWKRGTVGFPLEYVEIMYAKLRVGLRKIMNNGVGAAIVVYRSSNDMDILFDTGELKQCVRYCNFIRGTIATSERFCKVGMQSVMSNGMMAEIIAYRKYSDIDIQFKDGVVRNHVGCKEFKKGYIAHDTKDEIRLSRIGETVLHKKLGMIMSIIEYRSAVDIDVQFEDGAIAKNKTYSVFCKGLVQYPIKHYVPVLERVGKQFTMHNGLQAECIAYNNTHDISIKFLIDDVIVEHKSWHDFVMGVISHPNIKPFASFLERNVIQYFESIGFENYCTQIMFKDDNLTGVGGRYLSYDFAIFDDSGKISVLIECQGQQHYKPLEFFGGEEQFEIQMLHDELKREYAHDRGIQLIEIPYTEDSYEKVVDFLENFL